MNNYQLYFSLRSPFARRIRLALHRLKFPFELVEENVLEPSTAFKKLTPLGMVPVLLTPEGEMLTDSNALLEVLNDRSSGKIWPENRELRERVRQTSVFAAGVMTYTVSHFLEAIQSSPSEAFLKDCEATLKDTLKLLMTDPRLIEIWNASPINTAGWDIAIAAQYLDVRFSRWNWREDYPLLSTHVKRCMEDSEFAASVPPPPPAKK